MAPLTGRSTRRADADQLRGGPYTAMWVRKFITLPWLVDGWCVFCTAERGEHGDAGDWTNQRLKTEGPLAEPGNHDETCIWREAIEYIDASRSEVPDPR